MDAQTVWTDDNLGWFSEMERRWVVHERKAGSLVIQFGGLAFAGLLGILLLPGGPYFSLAMAASMWVSIVMICVCADSRKDCLRWLKWHREIKTIANPSDWPLVPSRAP